MLLIETQLVAAANDARVAAHVSPVTESPLLTQAAIGQATAARDAGALPWHDWPTGTSPASRVADTGYEASFVLENAALFGGGSIESRHAKILAAFTDPLNHPDHYWQTTHPDVTQIGVGVVEGTFGSLDATWAVVVLARPVAVPEPAGVGLLMLGGAMLLRRRMS